MASRLAGSRHSPAGAAARRSLCAAISRINYVVGRIGRVTALIDFRAIVDTVIIRIRIQKIDNSVAVNV